MATKKGDKPRFKIDAPAWGIKPTDELRAQVAEYVAQLPETEYPESVKDLVSILLQANGKTVNQEETDRLQAENLRLTEENKALTARQTDNNDWYETLVVKPDEVQKEENETPSGYIAKCAFVLKEYKQENDQHKNRIDELEHQLKARTEALRTAQTAPPKLKEGQAIIDFDENALGTIREVRQLMAAMGQQFENPDDVGEVMHTALEAYRQNILSMTRSLSQYAPLLKHLKPAT